MLRRKKFLFGLRIFFSFFLFLFVTFSFYFFGFCGRAVWEKGGEGGGIHEDGEKKLSDAGIYI